MPPIDTIRIDISIDEAEAVLVAIDTVLDVGVESQPIRAALVTIRSSLTNALKFAWRY